MPTKKTQSVTTIWRLRVPASLVRRVKELAAREKRSTTKQAEMLLQRAVEQAGNEAIS